MKTFAMSIASVIVTILTEYFRINGSVLLTRRQMTVTQLEINKRHKFNFTLLLNIHCQIYAFIQIYFHSNYTVIQSQSTKCFSSKQFKLCSITR